MNGDPAAAAMVVPLPRDTPADRTSALFDAHHVQVYRLARRLASSADHALDLMQDVFLRVARDPSRVPHGAEAEQRWLLRVTINLRRDQWRKAEVRARHVRPLGRSDATPATQEDEVVARATLWRGLDVLPPRRRAILVLSALDGMDVAGIARVLGLTRITVRWHLSKARRELAAALAQLENRR
jgi:RNA polymerase sigma-70 factor (ECF subfamily)